MLNFKKKKTETGGGHSVFGQTENPVNVPPIDGVLARIADEKQKQAAPQIQVKVAPPKKSTGCCGCCWG
jgi:hypothetical protein